MKKFITFIFLFPLINLAESASIKNSGSFVLPSVAAGESSDNDNFFYLDFNEGYTPPDGISHVPAFYEINTTEEYGNSPTRDSLSNCEIDREEPNSKNLICILDILEEDFLYSSVHIPLTVNVPKEMCFYLETTPAWHWNSKPVKGQTLDIGGPGRTSWNYYHKDGFPLSEIEQTIMGKKKNILIQAQATEVNSPSDLFVEAMKITNYMEVIDRSENKKLEVQELPLFLQPFSIASSGKVAPNPYYRFTCLDDKGEVKQEVKLLIQKWNTAEEFYEHYHSGGLSLSNPNFIGVEGADCSYESPDRKAGPCHDFCDLDDIAMGLSHCKNATGYPNLTYMR